MRRTDWKTILSEMALDFLLLLLIQGGLLWSLRSTYGLELSRKAFLLRAILPAAVVPWLLVRLPKRRLFLLGAAALLALAGWYWHDVWLSGGCQLLQQALTALAVPVEVESQWLTGSARDVLWTVTYFSLLLSMTLGMSILLVRSAALSWALSLPWLAPAVIFTGDVSWIGLLALTAGGCLLLLTGRSHHFDRSGSVRQAWMALPPLLAALALIAVLLPRQEYQRPQWAESLRGDLEEVGGKLNSGMFGDLGGLLPGGDQVSVSLAGAGPRSFREDVVLEVESDYHGTVYLRGTSAAIYTGKEWEDLPESVYEAGIGDDGMPNTVQGYSPFNFPAIASTGKPYYEITITYPQSLSGWMFTPYQLLSTQDEISDVSFVNDTHLEREFGVRKKNLFFIPPEEIQVLSRNTQWDAAVAEAQYRAFVYQNYLTIPDGFVAVSQRFIQDYMTQLNAASDGELANLLSNGRAPFAVIQAKIIAHVLSVMTKYDLETPLTPEGEDFVDYFLNESRQGYCVHYASAGALMLRSIGIPARYVTGYLVKIPASGKAEVLDSDAHAWVEIYLDGYGWYPVEMTPPAEIGLSEGEGIGEPAPEPAEPQEPDTPDVPETPDTPEQKPDQPKELEVPDTPQQTTEEPAEEQKDHWNMPDWLPWALAGVVLVALVPLRSRYCNRRRDRMFSNSDYSQAVLAMYRHLEQLRTWGADPETLRELAQKAQFSRQGLTEAEWRQAVDLWLQERKKLDQLPKVKRFWLHWILGVI